MALEIAVGPPVLSINHGHTVLVTEPDGQIRTSSDEGLYFFDTRLISTWQMFANGVPWELLNSGNITYHTCRIFLTNDSGAMHVTSALGVPTVTIFGATDDTTTGPTGPLARVIREHAECSPCLLRECPIDHRCMTRVTADRVAAAALELIDQTTWTHEPKL